MAECVPASGAAVGTPGTTSEDVGPKEVAHIPGVSYFGQFDAINTRTGRIVWKIHTPQLPLSGVAVGGNLVFFGEENGRFLAGCVALSAVPGASAPGKSTAGGCAERFECGASCPGRCRPGHGRRWRWQSGGLGKGRRRYRSAPVAGIWPPGKGLRADLALLRGVSPGEFCFRAQPVSVGGRPVLRDFLESVGKLLLRVGYGDGEFGDLAPQPRRLLLNVRCAFLCVSAGHAALLPLISHLTHGPGRLPPSPLPGGDPVTGGSA